MLRSILIGLSHSEALRNFTMKNSIAKRASRRFVAGETLKEGIEAAKVLNSSGIEVTMDFLGENTKNKEEAIACAEEVIKILKTMEEEKIPGNASVKLTQLGLDLGVDFCEEIVIKILEEAKKRNSFLRIDMEGSPYTEITLSLFYKLLEKYNNVGIVIQAYLYRSMEDVKRIIEKGGRIRLCKGAYKEPKTIAFPKKSQVDENFIKIMKVLLDSGIYHGIATHDENMIKATIDYAKEKNISPEAFEFQMLYGIRRDLQLKLVQEGWRMRVYLPYGTHWYPYFMRRLAERPANLFFILKNLFRG
ncbi:MAG: proline dehydrogenase family protein [Thermoanaerobaculia bacterium]